MGTPKIHWTKKPGAAEIIKRIADKKRGVSIVQKGHPNKFKGKSLPWIGHSKPHTEEAKIKMSINASTRKGNENNNWKGDDVGNIALHSWVKRQLGRPMKCEHCGTTKKRMYHWANKSHEYKREVGDWIRLCVPCHKRYDLAFINR